jgi:hypothetical protein
VQCAKIHLELDGLVTEIDRRDCGGSLESAAERLKKVTAEIETARIKKNFKKVRNYIWSPTA